MFEVLLVAFVWFAFGLYTGAMYLAPWLEKRRNANRSKFTVTVRYNNGATTRVFFN